MARTNHSQSDIRIEERIKNIVLHGTSSHPRAIQQAMSAFQSRWLVVMYRGLDKVIVPEILVILLLLPDEVFDIVFQCPSYFFYLYALATGLSNSICTETQLQELYELGVPESTILNQHHQLADLFSQFRLPDDFSLDQLILHLTLQDQLDSRSPYHSDTTIAKADMHTDSVWDALNSKDPARIFQADYDSGDDVRKLFAFQMSSALTGLINQSPENLANLSTDKISQVQNSILVSGFLDGFEAIDLLCDVLLVNGLPHDLQLRVLYSISHFASRKGSHYNKISQTIIDFISDEKQDLRSQVCAARLLRHYYLDINQIKALITIMEDSDKKLSKILHHILLDTFIKFARPEMWASVVDAITPERLSPYDVISLLNAAKRDGQDVNNHVVNVGKWPVRKQIVDYLISLSIENAQYRYDAIGLLRNHVKQEQVMQWMKDLLFKLHESQKSITDQSMLKSLEDDSWNSVRDVQVKLSYQWQENCWISIVQYLKMNNWPEDMIRFIPAMLETKMVEAVSLVENIAMLLPPGKWTETTLENLFKLTEIQALDEKTRQKALATYNLLANRRV